MEQETNRLCLICCCSYPVAVDLEIGSWKDSSSFDKFLVELEQSPGGKGASSEAVGRRSKGVTRLLFSRNHLLRSLQSYGNQVAVCWECLELINEAVEMVTKASEAEKVVIRLQKELMAELRKLQGCMTEYYGKMRRIEDNVKNSDVSCLESLIGKLGGSSKRRKGIEDKKGNGDLIAFRNKIIEVTDELGKFNTKVGNSFHFNNMPTLGLTLTSQNTFAAANPEIKEEPYPDVLDHDDDLTSDTFNEYENPITTTSNVVHTDSDGDQMSFDNGDADFDGNYEISSEDASDSESDFDPSELPTKKKKSKSSKNNKSGKPPVAIPSINYTGMSKLKKGIVAMIVRRQIRRSIILSQQQSDNPLDIPLQHRHPITYNNSIGTMAVADTEITLQNNQLCCSACNFKTLLTADPKRPRNILDSIYNHVIGRHYNAFQCQLCPKTFLSRKKFKAHLILHNKPTLRMCDICGKSLSDSKSLIYHKWLHLNEEEKAEAIRNGTAPQAILRKGRNQEEAISNFKCTTCNKNFQSLITLQQHQVRGHKNLQEETIICPKCGKAVKKRSYKNYHQKYVCPVGAYQSNARPVTCLQCGNTYPSEHNLKLHVARMHDEVALARHFICDVCGKGFKSDTDRKVHAKTHSQDKPWCCEKCGRGFKSNKNLKRHACRAAKMQESIKSESEQMYL